VQLVWADVDQLVRLPGDHQSSRQHQEAVFARRDRSVNAVGNVVLRQGRGRCRHGTASLDYFTSIFRSRGPSGKAVGRAAPPTAAQFDRHGIRAASLSGESERSHREAVQGQLRRREINFLFVVDLYNEGVDIPEVDTVLFLRPTESLTVFLQQLGRGLRLDVGKDCLTVLDFIGQANRNFRFDLRYRALLTGATLSVAEQVESGFSHLPAGCTIQMERIAGDGPTTRMQTRLS
jgi:ERCC4-related helicase